MAKHEMQSLSRGGEVRHRCGALCAVSLWRVREERRRKAMDRDHRTIRLLQRQVQDLEMQLRWRHDWWYDWRWAGGSEDVANRRPGGSEDVANRWPDHPTQSAYGIDYSKWDNIECSSSDPPHEGDDNCETIGDWTRMKMKKK